ncbi:MAG TPA: signal recognition particle receptor subunit alpha, partial [candidate division Zixibacteria bacterium]|nr:signal recognition particle receptor subunit alpha [candidate division Zixibacteria bacterium]
MFTELSSKFDKIFNKLRGYARLSESNIKEALKEVKVALLEADVNYKVVKDFISSIEQKSLGQETFKGVKPGQLLIKLVYDELVELLGKENKPLRFSGTEPTVFMLTGLQGSGKTTTCGKIAKFYEKKGKKPLLVAADIYRPAAIEQLKILGKNLKIPTFS